jgi:tetratricopeptide (TPR) repeat protein
LTAASTLLPSPPLAQFEQPVAGARNLIPAIATLFNAGHYEQAFTHATRALELDPNSACLHYYRGLAALNLKRPHDLLHHVQVLLQIAPGDSRAHHLAALHFHRLRKSKLADKHIQEAIIIDPACSIYHRHAAAIAAGANKIQKARAHIQTALQLDPTDPDSIHCAVQLQSLSETAAWQSWQRIQRLHDALALDPNNAAIHVSIGNIYLEELDRPKEAEAHFRDSLRLDPRDRDAQRLLFRAVGKQRLIYRVISIPSRALDWLGQCARGLRLQPWRIIFVLFGFKIIVILAFWLIIATIIFWPPAKAYEWLLLQETRSGAATAEWRLRLKALLHRWPFPVRFGVFAAALSAFWILIIRQFSASYKTSIIALSTFVGIHFFFTLLSIACRKLRSKLGHRQARKRLALDSTTPPLLQNP